MKIRRPNNIICYFSQLSLAVHDGQTHIPEVLRKTGHTLSDENDEHVESAHYTLEKMEENHGYKETNFLYPRKTNKITWLYTLTVIMCDNIY